MAATRQQLLTSAMELSEADRLLRATELMDTLADDLPGMSIDDHEFGAELERHASDGSKGIPWEQVESQLRADLDT